MNNMESLDEALDFLKNKDIKVNHAMSIIGNNIIYDRLSHKALSEGKKKVKFDLFHREIVDRLNKMCKRSSFSGVQFKLIGLYQSEKINGRVATVAIKEISKDSIEKFRSTFDSQFIKGELSNISKDVNIIDVKYCYTVTYNLYTLDIQYE